MVRLVTDVSKETLALVEEQFDADATGEIVGLAAVESIPQLRASDADMPDDAVAAAISNVNAIIGGLREGVAGNAVGAPEQSLEWAESLVHRAVDLSAVPWAYSFGQARVDEALRGAVDRADIPVDQKWEVASQLTRYVNAYVESVCAAMVDHYTVTRERHYGASGAVRREAVDALLDGSLTDAEAASKDLGYALDGPQVAAIVWSDPFDDSASAPMIDIAADLLGALGATRTLVLPGGQNIVWAWGGGDSVRDGLDQSLSVGPGVYASIGAVGAGLDGFVRSHNDAAQARRMSGILHRRPGSVVRYRSIALTSLIASDPRQAARFVEEELGAMVEDTDQMRRLRATLAVFLDEGMRPVRTGRRLGIHQNTVLYRIKQAEELLGRSVATRRLELESALRLADAREALTGFEPDL